MGSVAQWIQETLSMQGIRVETHKGLEIFGSLDMEGSCLDELPDKMTVHGHLNVARTSLPLLPRELCVHGDLHLWDTHVQDFPKDLRVGGSIFPPADLRDLQGFMEHRPTPYPLERPMSHHGWIALQDALQAFPDMITVVDHMTPGSRFEITRDHRGRLWLKMS